MGRPRDSKNVTDDELRAIRQLFRDGLTHAQIMAETGRGESTVHRAVKGLRRKRPPPPSGRHAQRNDWIIEQIEQGKTRVEIARRLGLSPSQVSTVVWRHPKILHLLRVRKLRPATVAMRYGIRLSTAVAIAQGTHRRVPTKT